MSSIFEIPLTPEAQTFQIQLGGVTYGLNWRWNVPGSSWTLDISNSLGTPLVTGIAVVTGVNLVGQYGYLGINGKLIAQTDHDPQAVPTLANLGNEGHVYFVTP